MKYYYKKSKKGYTYASYMKGDIPTDKPIYAFSYDCLNTSCQSLSFIEPIKGIVFEDSFLDENGLSSILKGSIVFIPFKKKKDKKGYTDELDYSKACYYGGLMYADTYKEACEMFNELVRKRIERLEKIIEITSNHFIKPKKKIKTNNGGLKYGKKNQRFRKKKLCK